MGGSYEPPIYAENLGHPMPLYVRLASLTVALLTTMIEYELDREARVQER